MTRWEKIWSFIEKNRWTTILPVLGVVTWIVLSLACTITTTSPLRAGVQVNAPELHLDYEQWLADCNTMAKRFEFAVADIERQQEQWSEITNALMTVASGNVTSFSGLLGIVMASGAVGLAGDNIRKNGVIGGLKRNKKT